MIHILPKAIVKAAPYILRKAGIYAAGTLAGMIVVDGVERASLSHYNRAIAMKKSVQKNNNAAIWCVMDKDGNVLYSGQVDKNKKVT